MGNTTQGKKPAEWFKQLKEPYRSEAIENIKPIYKEVLYKSLLDAAMGSILYSFKDLDKFIKSLMDGETTYLETENVSLINEVNNTQVTEQQNQIESEKVEVDWKAKFEELDAKYDALADSHSRLEFYDKELEKVVDEQSKLIKRLQNELQEKESKEKVYFCNTHKGYQVGGLEWAIKNSREQETIYEAICIGKKKSILESL